MALLFSINPGLLLVLAGIICAVTPIQRVRQVLAVATPLAAMALLLVAPHEVDLASMHFMDIDMVFYLSLIHI